MEAQKYDWKYEHTLPLSISAGGALDSLTPAQRSELQAGLKALKAHNAGRTPPPKFPPEFRLKVAAYAEAMIARKAQQA